MKKFFVFITLFFISIFLIIGCQKNNKVNTLNKTENSLNKIKKIGTLKVGVDDSYPPMEFRDKENNLLGFDIDLSKEIGKELGVKVEFIPTDWKGIFLSLNSGKFDIIASSVTITEERKKEMGFTKPYINGGQIIAVKNNNTEIKTSQDLKGKIIGCQLGSTGDPAASKIKGTKEVIKYDKVTEAFHDLSIGRLDAVIVDAQVGGYYMQKANGGYKILDEKLTQEPQGIALRKKDKELNKAIQKSLDNLKNNGTLSKLSIKWFGQDIYK